MHRELCVCGQIAPMDLATRIVLVMHRREVSKTTATGRLALNVLPNHELHIHGRPDVRVDLNPLHTENRRVLLLYPGEGARVLSRELLAEDLRPVTLLVPDGSWNQAKRAAKRIPGMAQAELVTLPEGPASAYHLRREPMLGGLATFEAIARALGILESPAVQEQLEALFASMVERTMSTRALPGAPLMRAAELEAHPPLEIIYRDDDLVAVNKPAGMSVHRGWARDGIPALQVLRNQISCPVHPVHRLDRPTSGVLLFATSGEVHRLVQQQFTDHTVDKRYLALCRGHDETLTQVDHPLAKREDLEPRPAVTDFKLLGHFERYGLFEARPRHGRLHQIRRHLRHASHPIIGDVRYGKGEHNRLFRTRFGFHRLALHALSLSLRHPRTEQPLTLRAALPPEFSQLLEALQLLGTFQRFE
jgi:tRNA pseudouridine65 synthase